MDDYVQDDEILYRCIFFNSKGFDTNDLGELIVTSAAFLDPNNQPSVDRAKLCNSNPKHTQKGDERNGVVLLIAKEIRAIADVIKHDDPPVIYEIGVVYVPLPENPAHAEIRANPQIASKSVFRRLRTSLAYLANQRDWLIRPARFPNEE